MAVPLEGLENPSISPVSVLETLTVEGVKLSISTETLAILFEIALATKAAVLLALPVSKFVLT